MKIMIRLTNPGVIVCLWCWDMESVCGLLIYITSQNVCTQFRYGLYVVVILSIVADFYTIFLPISFRVASPALGQSYNCPSSSEATLNDMGKTDYTKTHNKVLKCVISGHKSWGLLCYVTKVIPISTILLVISGENDPMYSQYQVSISHFKRRFKIDMRLLILYWIGFNLILYCDLNGYLTLCILLFCIHILLLLRVVFY